MKTTATWGGIQTPEKLLWVRLVDRNTLMFETGMSVITGGERGVVVGLSLVDMALRKTILPFTRRDQIWAVLPQEAMDSLINRFDNPSFALQWEPVEEGASVFFALCEQKILDELLARLAEMEIKPMGLVMAELAAWPLLDAANLLPPQTSILVVDGSGTPPSVYAITAGRLQELRVVSLATVARGETAVLEELEWLVPDLLNRLPNTNPTEIKMVFLGYSPSFWQPLWEKTGLTQIEVPGLETLGQGLRSWEWLRPAGLALAAAQGSHARLMDFLDGAGEKQWQTWLRPWQGAAIMLLILVLIWSGHGALRYTQAKNHFDTLKTETEAIFRDAMPHVPVIMDPQLQLKQALGQSNQAKDGQTQNLGTWIHRIQTSIPADTQVKWLRLRYEPGDVQLTGEVPSYQHLDRVRASMQQASGGRETRMDEARIADEYPDM